MLIGAQVSQAGGLVAAIGRAEEMGAGALQVFVQSNRQWRMPDPAGEAFRSFRDAAAQSAVAVTVCHAPYLINVISPDAEVAARSYGSLVANLRAATAIGASGLVLHPGSHRGIEPESAPARIARAILRALDEAEGQAGRVCDLLLENTAGAGATVGRSFEEIAAVIREGAGDERIGMCLDTQHLWASGYSFASIAEADELVDMLDAQVGLARLRCLHVNDSAVPFASSRDRHANLGEGTIGRRPLEALLGHPRLQGLPAILEVPGVDRHGPGASDIAEARSIHAAGLAARPRVPSRTSALSHRGRQRGPDRSPRRPAAPP